MDVEIRRLHPAVFTRHHRIAEVDGRRRHPHERRVAFGRGVQGHDVQRQPVLLAPASGSPHESHSGLAAIEHRDAPKSNLGHRNEVVTRPKRAVRLRDGLCPTIGPRDRNQLLPSAIRLDPPWGRGRPRPAVTRICHHRPEPQSPLVESIETRHHGSERSGITDNPKTCNRVCACAQVQVSRHSGSGL